MIPETLLLAALAATPISLEQVRQESKANTPARIAELERLRADERIRFSRSAILPHLSARAGVGAQYAFGEQAAGDGFLEFSATLSQLLFDGGRWWTQIAQSGALAEAEEGRAREQQLASEFEGVRRFLDLYRAQETLRVLEATAKRSEEQLDRARSLYEAGRIQQGDVFAAQVNLGNDRLALTRQRARIAAAQGQLAAWLARPGTEGLVAETPEAFARGAADGANAPTVDDALAKAREARPLLKAVSKRARAAELSVGLASADYWPRAGLSVTAGRLSPSLDPRFADTYRQDYLQAGLELQWDLFSGLSTSAQVQQARLARRQADAELAQAERELESDVRTAVIQLEVQRETVAIAREVADSARKGLEVAEGRFRAGAGSTLEVRDAQLKLTQAELSLIESLINVELARAALERTLGTGANT